jgi:hypothetical protein
MYDMSSSLIGVFFVARGRENRFFVCSGQQAGTNCASTSLCAVQSRPMDASTSPVASDGKIMTRYDWDIGRHKFIRLSVIHPAITNYFSPSRERICACLPMHLS